jgi:hypothetical protein
MRDPETFYDATAEDEWNRLDEGLDGRLEFSFTTDELDAVLPDAGHVVDVGGGAGRYAVRLARRRPRCHARDGRGDARCPAGRPGGRGPVGPPARRLSRLSRSVEPGCFSTDRGNL